MKGEYDVEEENEKNNVNNNNNNMFAKFSHHPKFHPPPPPPSHHHNHNHNPHFPPPHLQSHHPFSQPSEEADSATTTTTPPFPQPPSKKPKTTNQIQTTTATSNEDGGTIEVSRRPRGRPPGSKNKPKPPVVITREPEPAMSPYILELPSGADVIDSIMRFTRRRGVGLCVLTASGAVANVTLKQPSTTTPGGTVTFHGRFDILSLSAVVVVNTVPFHGGGAGFTISLAGPQGQIVGGKVVGALVCSGTVYVVAASFNNPTYCRLPLDEQEGHQHDHHNSQQSEEHDGGDGSGPGSISLYTDHHMNTTTRLDTTTTTAGVDVIWAAPSSARPPY